MANEEKFEGLKKRLLEENETKYGKEIREKYGEKKVEESNAKFMNMTKEDFERQEALSKEILSRLSLAVKEEKDPTGPDGMEIAALHEKWLRLAWTDYNKDAHAGLVKMYIEDERFKAYYDRETPGCADFLCKAVIHYINQ